MLFTAFGCSLALFGSVWSGVWDSNVWECGPKRVSEPSAGTLQPSLALSAAPALPLWHSFALVVSRKNLVFWDLYGMGFCILKDVPSGLSRDSGPDQRRGGAQKLRRINKE